MGSAYTFTWMKLRARRSVLNDIVLESPARMRALGGVYRSRFMGHASEGMVFSAPLQRDAFVPLRIGEEITIELSLDEGRVLLFPTTVVDRCSITKQFTVERPSDIKVENRRTEKRTDRFAGERAQLNDEWAELIDISENGAKLHTFGRFEAGDVIRVQIDRPFCNTLAYVIDCVPSQIGGRHGCIVRVRFVDPLPPIPIPIPEK